MSPNYSNENVRNVRLALPKGRMEEAVFALLREAGIALTGEKRGYRPWISLPNFEVKILKPQSIIQMLHSGSRDIGFAGADWVYEHGANVVEILDTGLDSVRLIAAAPKDFLLNGELPNRHIVIASEYENLTRNWIARKGLDATFVHSYGATEVFPPEDADCIVDNTSTGSTLRANNLAIVDELMSSSTRLYASPMALESVYIREQIEVFGMLIRSVLEARLRVMVEVNVQKENLDAVVRVLPCMRQATISELQGGAGFAVKGAVPKNQLAQTIPKIRNAGGTDIVVTNFSQIIP